MEENKKVSEACDEQSCKDNLMMGLMAILAEEEEKSKQQQEEREKE